MDPKITLENASTIQQLGAALGATGALGTAAMGLVDAFKTLPYGGVSYFGFGFIKEAIAKLAPPVESLGGTELSPENIRRSLLSQWINGTATADQVSIAKSLIKLRLIPETAPALAQATGVDATILGQVAQNLKNGAPLDSQSTQADVYGRFDLLLTTLLDQAYQRASQRYRNAAKTAAVLVSVALALFVVWQTCIVPWHVALIIGLVATPLAPVSKDLATGLTAAMQALQSWKK